MAGPYAEEHSPLLGSALPAPTERPVSRGIRNVSSSRHYDDADNDDDNDDRWDHESAASKSPPESDPIPLSRNEQIFLFFGIFVVGYSYGLDSQVRLTFQPEATSDLNFHSFHSTINVLRSIAAVAFQPAAAKLSDMFGRFPAIVVFTFLYTIGTAIQASASSVEAFCVGATIYQIGYTCIILLMEVLVADLTSMRSRVFFSYVPAVPFLINTWISGAITSQVLKVTTWRWGIGMWSIIYPLSSIPLLVSLYPVERRARRQEAAAGHQRPVRRRTKNNVFSQIDTIGLLLLAVSFSLTLAPLTLAGGSTRHWRSPGVISSLVIGIVLIPVFIIWERRVSSPLIPFHLLKDRGVWSALAVRALLNFAWQTQGNYLYTVLVVAFDFSVETATRITSFFSFFGVLSGVVAGLLIYRLRRLKRVIVIGTIIFMAAFALLIVYPGGATDSTRSGVIGAQVLLGLAGGLFAYPTQASIQACTTPQHVATLTGLYLSFYNVGSALGSCLSGAIWTQTLLPTLEANLAFQPDDSLAEAVYSSPFSVALKYPVGGEIREAIIDSYCYVQRLLCIAGFLLCVPMIGFALALRNPKLSEQRHQPASEADEDDST